MARPPSYIGIEIGGTKLQLVRGTAHGEIHERRRLEVDPAQGATGIRGQIAQALSGLMQLSDGSQVQRIAVGFGGPVVRSTGRVACSHQIEGWSDFPMRDWLQEVAGCEALIENDANVAALGEAMRGAGQGYDHSFYVTLGSGVGGGFVSHGKIFHGELPGEVEVGHLRLDATGRILEHSCSGWGVDRKIRGYLEDPSSHPDRWADRVRSECPSPGGEARYLAEGLQKSPAVCSSILDQTVGDLCLGLSHVVHLLHPGVIVVGGGLSLIGEPLLERIRTQLPRLIMEVFQPGPDILAARLAEDAVPVGALLLAANPP